jgi:hypothetical protein
MAGYVYRGSEFDAQRQLAEPKPRKPRTVAVCGTIGGVAKHRRLKEPICESCAAAARAYKNEWRARVNANNPKPPKVQKPRVAKEPKPERIKRAYSREQQCGIYAGYSRHIRYKETPCAPCRAANTAYYLAWYAKRKKAATFWTGDKCGTVAGHSSHRYYKLPICDDCKAAKSAADAEWRAKRRAA